MGLLPLYRSQTGNLLLFFLCFAFFSFFFFFFLFFLFFLILQFVDFKAARTGKQLFQLTTNLSTFFMF